MTLDNILKTKMIPEQFGMGDYLEPNVYKVFFKKRPQKRYLIAVEVAKRAALNLELENIFKDDNSVNHLVLFTEDQAADLMLIHDCIFSTGFIENIWGYDIHGVDLKFICNFSSFCGGLTKLNNKMMSKATNEILELLMQKFGITNSMYAQLFIRKNYLEPIHQEFQKVYSLSNKFYKVRDFSNEAYEERKKIKQQLFIKKEKIYHKLVSDGKMPIKWRAEYSLYELITKFFPDALFQYSPNWLGRQSFDVYVPSVNLAFEYQGIQHYEPVDYFGGIDAFNQRQYLDNLKREKSLANGVNIIEWHYEEPIIKLNLSKKLQEVNIII